MRVQNLSTDINPIDLMDKPSIPYKVFYDYYADWFCKAIAAAAYLVAAGLFLFPSIAPIVVAFGLSLGAGFFMLLGAMADYHKACAEHTEQIAKLQKAIPKIISDDERQRFNRDLQKHIKLGLLGCLHYPSVSLIASAASFALTSSIAVLHLAQVITASSIFSNPFLLMGLIILNLAFLLVKDSLVNRLVEYTMQHISLLSKKVADELNRTQLKTSEIRLKTLEAQVNTLETLNTKFQVLQAHLPAALQRNIGKPVAELQVLAAALPPSLHAKPNSLTRSNSAIKLMVFATHQQGAGIGIEQNAGVNSRLRATSS